MTSFSHFSSNIVDTTLKPTSSTIVDHRLWTAMAVPGFSLAELSQALGHTKKLYNAFLQKNKDNLPQVRHLVEDIENFSSNVLKHRDILKRHGIELSGIDAAVRTLAECHEFLMKCESVVGKPFIAYGAFKKARFDFVQNDVDRLRSQIKRHEDNMSLQIFRAVLLDQSLHQNKNVVPLDPVSQPLQITESSYLPSISATQSSLLPTPGHTPELLRNPGYGLLDLAMPPSRPTPLPNSALPYTVAKLYLGSKFIELKGKLVGRNFPNGRELVIVDESGNQRFTHRIKLSPNTPCYPFTIPSSLGSHEALEVTFRDSIPNQHSIVFKGTSLKPHTARYIFSTESDYIDFQSQIRGKELLCSPFNFRQIRAGGSPKQFEARHQHLKIWKDRSNNEYSISFYASIVKKPQDLEFPISMFSQNLRLSKPAGETVDLRFEITVASGRRFSGASSRYGLTEVSSSVSSAASASSIFSRGQSVASTAPSESWSSFSGSRASRSPSRLRTSMSPIETQAMQLQFLRIVFPDSAEAARFEQLFQRVRAATNLQIAVKSDAERSACLPDSLQDVPSPVEGLSESMFTASRDSDAYVSDNNPSTSKVMTSPLDELDERSSTPDQELDSDKPAGLPSMNENTASYAHEHGDKAVVNNLDSDADTSTGLPFKPQIALSSVKELGENLHTPSRDPGAYVSSIQPSALRGAPSPLDELDERSFTTARGPDVDTSTESLSVNADIAHSANDLGSKSIATDRESVVELAASLPNISHDTENSPTTSSIYNNGKSWLWNILDSKIQALWETDVPEGQIRIRWKCVSEPSFATLDSVLRGGVYLSCQCRYEYTYYDTCAYDDIQVYSGQIMLKVCALMETKLIVAKACGKSLYDDFTELKPGAAKRLETSLIDSDSDLEAGLAKTNDQCTLRPPGKSLELGAVPNTSASSSSRSTAGAFGSVITTQGSVIITSQQQESLEALFLLLCLGKGNYGTILRQPNVCSVRSDNDLFQVLRNTSAKRNNNWASMLSFKTIRSIKFVSFELFTRELVDIKAKDELPPIELVGTEYRYDPAPPETMPPVGEHHLLHLLKHPNDACFAEGTQRVLRRLPKRLNAELDLRLEEDTKMGWGLHFKEGLDTTKVIITAFIVFGLGSLAWGLVWTVSQGSIQDAFAVSAWWITMAPLTIAFLHAWYGDVV